MKIITEVYKNIRSQYGNDLSEKIQLSPLLFSSKIIELPKEILLQAQGIAKELNNIKRDPNFLKQIAKDNELPISSSQHSILTSLDFHLDDEKNLKLIEVNTNASAYLLCDLLYKAQNLPALSTSPTEEIMKNIANEYSLFKKNQNSSQSPLERIAIIDEHPEQQNMYGEFLLFKQLFQIHGYKSSIHHFADLTCDPVSQSVFNQEKQKIDFIYNRYCDFYLSLPKSKTLRESYLNHAACFSPNPKEYQSIADKNRLFELSQPSFWTNEMQSKYPQLQKSLLQTQILNEQNSDQMWKNRKKLFFKPSQSYGSKQVYRGSGISSKKFKEILPFQFIAQEFLPAPKTSIKEALFKFDLRFFTYADTVTLAIARTYQGQVTNMKTPEGGFSCISFI